MQQLLKTTKQNRVLQQANQAYREKNFGLALELYKKAAEIYGRHLVKVNIAACKKHLPKVKQSFTQALDPITSILLHNSGERKLNQHERKEALKAFDKLIANQPEVLTIKDVNPTPPDWPEDLELVPLPEGPNDFEWYIKYRYKSINREADISNVGLSIIIPTFNRCRILDITLACLINQDTNYPFEVIVADDGSKEDLMPLIRCYEKKLDIKYVRQKDYGYQLCAVRNLGLRTAKYEFVSILDCDMAPGRNWVRSYVDELIRCDDIAFIGPRKYVDTHGISADDVLKNVNLISSLPEVKTSGNLGNSVKGEISVDWRLDHFRKTENLRLCDSPFRYFSGGNVAFSKKWLRKVGWFDEEFTHWGGEDNEFGFRLFRAGCFFKVIDRAMAYHQEPPGRENETDRAAGKARTIKIVQEKVPYFYRRLAPIQEAMIHRIPLVSIYIPAYNCEEKIKKCVDSALNQTITDLEVCICDDGSTDNTLAILKENYFNNPRVRFVRTVNGGIGKASNNAVRLCRGFYIGQLDSDDYLEPKAVELCLREFLSDRNLVCVYTSNRNVRSDGSLISNGYNWPKYSREKLTSAMICHHFRMFSVRAWNLTEGFNEKIANAVDYDMYLKLSEIGPFKHINAVCYNRVLHGENTSVKKLGQQKVNHFKVVNEALSRQGISGFSYRPINLEDDGCRKYSWEIVND